MRCIEFFNLFSAIIKKTAQRGMRCIKYRHIILFGTG
jgi:hypothetical protein